MKYASLKSTDFIGGLLTVCLSFGVLYESQGYGFGSVLSMGPGFFPTLLGVLLLCLGLCLAVRGVSGRSEAVQIPSLRPVLYIIIAVLLFSILLLRFGLAPATIALVVISSLASRKRRLSTIIVSALLMAIFTYFIFIKGLAMNLSAVAW